MSNGGTQMPCVWQMRVRPHHATVHSDRKWPAPQKTSKMTRTATWSLVDITTVRKWTPQWLKSWKSTPTFLHYTQPDNLNVPHISHTGELKPFTSKLHAFAKQNHPSGKVRTSNPELRRLANDRGHVHSYYHNLWKLSPPPFGSNQSDLDRSVKKFGANFFKEVWLFVFKRSEDIYLTFLISWRCSERTARTVCLLLCKCYVNSKHFHQRKLNRCRNTFHTANGASCF